MVKAGESRALYYHIGIIDYFQLYDLKKWAERHVKRAIKFKADLDTSSTDPVHYSKRF